ncbi:amino acid permease [Roseiterribacter gracilis]|uniref:Amino acid permease n=1 Tax=Roseiterribacter gracilis TaxID=2812848 RepID=A0A8S8XBU7_9PROT|nr:amino acid permease [Rhodospirillales bacterium TMPK1]
MKHLLARKSIESLQLEADRSGMQRSLGATHLLLLGIGCILGAGIYVMTGNAAAHFAGPAVMLSFILAGAACALTALCYAELASTMPVSGSAYTYCYAAVGEVFAWVVGWVLLFDYGIAASLLAVGFSGYLVSLLHDLGVHIPVTLAQPMFNVTGVHGGALVATGGANLIAVAIILLITAVLVRGVTQSAFFNNLLVAVKILVLVSFVVVGAGAIDPGNWTPFIPPNEGGFAFGWQGVVRAASILFFAYIGFETVSTAACEARNPQRDLPIGILGSLLVCTLLYIIVAAVLTGIVPFRALGVPDPIAIAADRMGRPSFAVLIKIGALTGLTSVLLVNAYGQSRVAFAMGRDRLLPPLFSDLHARFRTPHGGIILFGVLSAAIAALFPLSLLGDLISIGAGLAFSTVCVCLMWLRSARPDLPRPFRVPFGGFHIGRVWIGYVPLAAIILCWSMIVPVVIDIVSQAANGHVTPAVIVGVYFGAGALLYTFYGHRRATRA